MRSIQELLDKYNVVWFYIDDDVKPSFVIECNKYGYRFYNGKSPLTADNCGSRMALCAKNKTIAFVAGMIWFYSFKSPEGLIRRDGVRGPDGIGSRVNYRNYINGESRYVYKSLGVLGAPDKM